MVRTEASRAAYSCILSNRVGLPLGLAEGPSACGLPDARIGRAFDAPAAGRRAECWNGHGVTEWHAEARMKRLNNPDARAGLGAALVLILLVAAVELADGPSAHYVGLFAAAPFLAAA